MVFRQGRKSVGRYVALHYIYINEDQRRLGVTVSKRVDKKAVTRNRLKRIFREIFRMNKGAFPKGCDIILRALPRSADADYGELRYEILSLAENIKSETMAHRPDQTI
jgi:ribonuclease P protein component